MGAKMVRRKFVRAGHKNDMWFVVEEVIYIPSSPVHSEKSQEYIIKIFYDKNNAENYLK